MRRRPFTAPSFVLLVSLLASQAALIVLTPILVEVAQDLDVSTATAGQVRALTGLVAGLTALAFGRLGRGIPLRDLLLGGAGLLALGSVACAAAPNFTVFVAAQVPIGVAVAVLVSAGAAAAGEWPSPGERTRVLSWTLIGPAAGWVIGMPLVGIVAEWSWRLSFLVLPLGSSLVVAFALSLCRKEHLPSARPLVHLRDLLGERVVGTWALGELLASSAWAGTLVYAGALFVESYGTSSRTTGLLLGAVVAAYLPGNFLAARLVATRSALSLLPGATLVAAAGLVVFGALRPSPLVSALVLAGLVFVAGFRTLASGTFGLDAAPERRLAVMGIRGAALQFGYLFGSVAGGVALFLGGYTALGVLLGLVFLAAAVTYTVLRAYGGDATPAAAAR